MCLTQDASQRANGDFVFPWHDRSVDGLTHTPYEFDVATPLASFDEASHLKSALDFAKG
jgi:glycerol-3-phosphate dehydrogenase